MAAQSLQTVQFAPSLLSADFANLERDVRAIESVGDPDDVNGLAASPQWLHVDVMDGHFVPNLTIGPPVIRALKRVTSVPLDVHLMIDNPAEQLDSFIEAGADLITIHVECAGDAATRADASGECAVAARAGVARQPGTSQSIREPAAPELIHTLISRIHAAGRKAGLSLNPNTPPEAVFPFLSELDLVLVMSVHPGFGGQSFIFDSVERIETIANAIRARGASALIEVDGGINEQTAPLAVAAGARILVAGNAVFGADDPKRALQALRVAANAALNA